MLREDHPHYCVAGRCMSPLACNGFGYCRERHFLDPADDRYINPKKDKCAIIQWPAPMELGN